MKDQRGGDVVRQVADDSQGLVRRFQGAEIKTQGVAFVNAQPVGGVFLAQQGDQVPVQLDHMQMRDLFQQGIGQGAPARPDFHQGVARLQAQGANHAVDQIAVVQEVLAKAFTGAVFCHSGSQVGAGWCVLSVFYQCAISAASGVTLR